MSNRIYIAPAKYIQGPGFLSQLGEHAAKYGKQFFGISDETVWDIISDTVEESFKNSDAVFSHEMLKFRLKAPGSWPCALF